jgi:hypothetical protein
MKLSGKILIVSLFLLILGPPGWDAYILGRPLGVKRGSNDEYINKAVFLVKIASFIDWPDDSNINDTSKPFVLGFIGEDTEGKELKSIFSQMKIKEKQVEIRLISRIEEISSCNLLFIAQTGKIEYSKVFEMIKEKPILTVINARGMAQKGFHIGIYLRREKLRFEVNKGTMKKSMLSPSYHLLKQASKIY